MVTDDVRPYTFILLNPMKFLVCLEWCSTRL